ncbi:MAG: hypothetical protein DRI54_01955 [Bacteroidetes bacterium]|nr:MAG: hypothetical protein DRI54_01955 [Bacteroidota bacterium]
MGLSIHYTGCFTNAELLPQMIEEVKDIAEIYHWEYQIFESEFQDIDFKKSSYGQKIYGISFKPPDCETVSLTFLSNGRMSSVPNLKFYGNSVDPSEQKYLYMLSVKTQYAGIGVHKVIIHLLKYLDEKYFQDLEVIDEGQYWETGDDQLLQQIFDRYNKMMDNFASALENSPISASENYEDYFERLIKYIQNRSQKG